MIIIGIDPGVNGGIAFLKPAPFGSDANDEVHVHELPTVPTEGGHVTRRVHGPALRSMIRSNVPQGEACMAIVEQLETGGAMRPDRMNNHMTRESQAITHGTIICALEMLGLVLGESIKTVSPRRWKKLYGFGKDKKDALAIARELYPQLRDADLKYAKDHNKAEAVLIARWGMRCEA